MDTLSGSEVVASVFNYPTGDAGIILDANNGRLNNIMKDLLDIKKRASL